MTTIFLMVSIVCNVWFLFLLLYDRIMETKLVRFFRNIIGLWRTLDNTPAKQETTKETPSEETQDIIGKSRFKMVSTRTMTTIPVPQAATSEKGMELSEEDTTFDDGQVFLLLNWSSERTSRKRMQPTNNALRVSALTKSGKPSA